MSLSYIKQPTIPQKMMSQIIRKLNKPTRTQLQKEQLFRDLAQHKAIQQQQDAYEYDPLNYLNRGEDE